VNATFSSLRGFLHMTAELVPERTSTLTATLRRAWLGRGSGQVRGWITHIDDTQDLVPITIRDGTGAIVSVVDGPGNIGRGREWGVSLDLSLPLEKMLPLGDSGEVGIPVGIVRGGSRWRIRIERHRHGQP
jgi:hypothetical protein